MNKTESMTELEDKTNLRLERNANMYSVFESSLKLEFGTFDTYEERRVEMQNIYDIHKKYDGKD